MSFIIEGRRKENSCFGDGHDGAAAEHCETIRHERFVEFGNRVRALQVQTARELTDEVRGKGRVQTDGVVRAAGLRLTTEARQIGAKTRETKQVTFLLRVIAEGGDGARVARLDGPGQLAGV